MRMYLKFVNVWESIKIKLNKMVIINLRLTEKCVIVFLPQ